MFLYQTELLLSRPLMCFNNETCLAGFRSCTDFIVPQASEVMQQCSVSQDGNWPDQFRSLCLLCGEMQWISVGDVHYSTSPYTYKFVLNSSCTRWRQEHTLGFLWRWRGWRVERKTTAEQLQTTAPLSTAASPPSSIIHPFLHCIIYSSAFPPESRTPQYMHWMV